MSKPVHSGWVAFLQFLRDKREDRGIMADLRCALIQARESHAWPHLAKFCDLTKPQEKLAFSGAAVAFALDPGNEEKNNDIGTVMRRIATADNRADGLNTFRMRFQRLLACDSREELTEQLHGIFQAAKQKGIGIDPDKLFYDIWYWGNDVKLRWAQSFWGGTK